MPNDGDLTPADPREVVIALSLGLTAKPPLARYQAAETMATIVAKRLAIGELCVCGGATTDAATLRDSSGLAFRPLEPSIEGSVSGVSFRTYRRAALAIRLR
jgi:hypothetical protein